MTIRSILRKTSSGPSVKKLQTDLNNLLKPSPKLKTDGKFGKATDKAVRSCQKHLGIKIDGVVGPATWNAINGALNKGKPTLFLSKQAKLADIATQFIGVTETGDNRAGNNQKLLEIFNADDLVIKGKTDGYPWCAAFVSHCVQLLVKQSPFFSSLSPPREPSVSRFLNDWSKKSSCIIFKPDNETLSPNKGDIVVFTFSHIGIVESAYKGGVKTIEGNTNEAGSREGVTVARKQRTNRIIRAFIRLPMPISSMTNLNAVSRIC